MSLKKYRERVGLPSFIAQAVGVAWIAICSVVMVVMLAGAQGYEDERDGTYIDDRGVPMKRTGFVSARREREAATFWAIALPLGLGLGVAVPLGFTALLTMRRTGATPT